MIRRSDQTTMSDTPAEVQTDTAPSSDASLEPSSAAEITVGTDAAYAPPAFQQTRRPLRNISEVRHFFRTNEVPIYFVGATPFNLLGLDRWVRNFSYVTYYDGWDGAHPRVFSPKHKPYIEFESGEEINNWLLVNPEVRAHMSRPASHGQRAKVAMVFFDAETERICEELGYDLILPSAELREHLDSKLVTTRLGNEVGAASVPNVLVTVDEYQELVEAASAAGLGTDLVVQTAYGDSGKTTFFIDDETGWKRHRSDITGNEIKVMKRINNRPVAVEAVLTSNGTIVGPFMSELTGHSELTPYRGGWCGNEMYPEVLTEELRRKAGDLVGRLGDRLGAEGYRGFFEVDVLVDIDTDEVYLGELNPRISGASAITNVTAGAYADIPLFAFHLLEFFDVAFELDVEEINARWRELAAADQWSQMVIKETSPLVQLITAAAPTGQYSYDPSGALVYRRAALDWHQLQNESEAFFLRIYSVGDYRWKGADLGVLVTKGRLQRRTEGEADTLTIRGKHLIDSIRGQYAGLPLAGAEAKTAPVAKAPSMAK
jgi:D-alanine-D-alanine ligase-like ATP-grasp enzyme